MVVSTNSAAATEAQREAFDRILSNHLLYCTVCDNSNGDCTVHNTTRLLAVEHQNIPFRTKPYEVDDTNPFYRYDPDQCILCGRCVEACQNLKVNETLTINWEEPQAIYLIGEEMSIVDSNANYVEDAFTKLEFMVVQEVFFGDVCRYADVVLPAAASLEKEGTFTSSERRIQRFYEVFEPLDGCRPDWQIIRDVANHMGADWRYRHPSEIMDEIAALSPLFAGVSYERLEVFKRARDDVLADVRHVGVHVRAACQQARRPKRSDRG